jgi:hypothetical protein
MSTTNIASSVLVPSVAVCSTECESKYLARRGCHVVEKPKRKSKSNQQSGSGGSTSNKRQRQKEQSVILSKFPPRHVVHQLLRGERGHQQEQRQGQQGQVQEQEQGQAQGQVQAVGSSVTFSVEDRWASSQSQQM